MEQSRSSTRIPRASGTHYNRPPSVPTVAIPENAPSSKLVSVSDVQKWLSEIGYSQYSKQLLDNEVNGAILITLTSDELRDDLDIKNLRHRRDLLSAISRLPRDDSHSNTQNLPEHGRILDHLSNVRTYHSWIRIGVQFLAFAIVTLRLSPNFRSTPLITAASFYFALVGISALLYGVFRYKRVIDMIEASGPSSQTYIPDRTGIISMLVLAFVAFVLALVIIALRK